MLMSEVFETDSEGYEIFKFLEKIKDVPGAILEIGTRLGGSAKLIIDNLVENNDTNRLMICIDPYGNIPIKATYTNMHKHYPEIFADIAKQHNIPEEEFDSTEKYIVITADFSNNMKMYITPKLYEYAYSKGINFHFLHLTDEDFFAAFNTG